MQPYRVKSISEFHRFRGLPAPEHPLISVINLADVSPAPVNESSFVFDFYSLSLKKNFAGKIRYGQQQYDFDEGLMFFMAPNQVIKIEAEQAPAVQQSGWMLLIHPDFLWGTPLAKAIRQYDYFDYSVHEALFLSKQEESTITLILKNIQHEYRANIDNFSSHIVIAHIELLLSYAERFYHRQFLTRKVSGHQILEQLEAYLSDCFGNLVPDKGIPTVQQVAEHLHLSPTYLSSLLKVLTGQSAQQHIHNKLIEAAKEKLSTTRLSVSEIAYELGFEHPQSFNKLFKTKTALSPLAFRQSFQE